MQQVPAEDVGRCGRQRNVQNRIEVAEILSFEPEVDIELAQIDGVEQGALRVRASVADLCAEIHGDVGRLSALRAPVNATGRVRIADAAGEHIQIGVELQDRREAACGDEATVDARLSILAETRRVEVADATFECEALLAGEMKL